MAAARQEILSTAELVTGWYDGLAATLITGGELPQRLAHDQAADGRLVRAVRRDLLGDDGKAGATAVRMIWTGDHLDVVCRLQTAIISPVRATAGQLPAAAAGSRNGAPLAGQVAGHGSTGGAGEGAARRAARSLDVWP